VAADDSHGSKDSLLGFAPVRFSQPLAPGSIGGKHWVTVVRQDPKETFAPLADLVAKVLLYGLAVLAVLWGTGLLAARRIARPIQLLHGGVQEIGSGRLERRLELKTRDETRNWPMRSIRWPRIFSGPSGRSNSGWERCALEEKYRDLIEHSPEMIYQLTAASICPRTRPVSISWVINDRNAHDEAVGCGAARTGVSGAAIPRAAVLKAEHDGNRPARQRRAPH
jgi:hypothetical protein